MAPLSRPAAVQELVGLCACWKEERSGYLVSSRRLTVPQRKKFKLLLAEKSEGLVSSVTSERKFGRLVGKGQHHRSFP